MSPRESFVRIRMRCSSLPQAILHGGDECARKNGLQDVFDTLCDPHAHAKQVPLCRSRIQAFAEIERGRIPLEFVGFIADTEIENADLISFRPGQQFFHEKAPRRISAPGAALVSRHQVEEAAGGDQTPVGRDDLVSYE